MPDRDHNRPVRFRPLGEYRGLPFGPNALRDSVAAKSKALDGTKQRLRDAQLGSPFTFQILPPTVLLDALAGTGGAVQSDAFDPLLRQAFEEASNVLDTVLRDPNATAGDIAAAQQALLGTRTPPDNSQNIDIIESAMRSKNNFGALAERRRSFRRSNFFADGPNRGATLSRLDDMIAANGIRFNPGTVGESEANQAAISDLIQALDVIVQLNRVINTPPLTLLINPESLTVTYSKKQTYSDRNRFNYIFQSWGEEQVRLSVQGKSAGFVVGSGSLETPEQETNAQNTTPVSGYQYASKWDSAAWQNLMGLFSFYRNNGYIYDTAGRPRSEAHLFIGHVQITYDQWAYVGQFENFQYGYTEQKQQGAVDFSFEFTASQVYDRSQGGPVRPLPSPTPSPSAATRGGTDFMPPPQSNTTRAPDAPSVGGSSDILDPFVDPFSVDQQRASNRPQTLDPFSNGGR